MTCVNCGGAFEYAQGGKYCRCVRCLTLFTNEMGRLTPIHVEAPGGGHNPEFNAIFARNLGFGPPPNQGPQLHVRINGQTPESYAKNQVSSMVWGWIIGAVILLGIYRLVIGRRGASTSGTAYR